MVKRVSLRPPICPKARSLGSKGLRRRATLVSSTWSSSTQTCFSCSRWTGSFHGGLPPSGNMPSLSMTSITRLLGSFRPQGIKAWPSENPSASLVVVRDLLRFHGESTRKWPKPEMGLCDSTLVFSSSGGSVGSS